MMTSTESLDLAVLEVSSDIKKKKKKWFQWNVG